jgi:hypothetical protein
MLYRAHFGREQLFLALCFGMVLATALRAIAVEALFRLFDVRG